MKFLVVLGTRPEAIKLCPLILHLKQFTTVEVCVTGQHAALLAPFLKLFGVTPDYDLALMQPNQTLPELTARCLEALSKIIIIAKPTCVIVQGDTTTSFCAALAAFYEKIPVAHVEAGLRTHDIYSPFPEEINRQLITRIARYHFIPTETCRAHLLQEGCDENHIFCTGNTSIDALQWVLKHHAVDVDKKFNVLNKKIILVTGHRRENFGEPFLNICKAIRQIAEKFPEIEIIYPVHLNPNVQKPVYEQLADMPNVKLIAPLDYPDFIALMARASVILTDSGGVQEEAPSLRVPIVVMRDNTERPEGVSQGYSFLVGTDPEKIVNCVTQYLRDPALYCPVGDNPYGDGHAVEKISALLLGPSLLKRL